MILLEDLNIADDSIEAFVNELIKISIMFNKEILTHYDGNSHSVIKPNELHSACYRPFSTAFGTDIFSTDFDKSAALLDSLIQSHSFSDGNKRTALAVTEYFFQLCGFELTMNEDAKYQLVHDVEAHKYSIDQLSSLLKSHSR